MPPIAVSELHPKDPIAAKGSRFVREQANGDGQVAEDGATAAIDAQLADISDLLDRLQRQAEDIGRLTAESEFLTREHERSEREAVAERTARGHFERQVKAERAARLKFQRQVEAERATREWFEHELAINRTQVDTLESHLAAAWVEHRALAAELARRRWWRRSRPR